MFWSMEIALKSALLIGSAALVTWILRKSSASLRHAVWALALILLPLMAITPLRWNVLPDAASISGEPLLKFVVSADGDTSGAPQTATKATQAAGATGRRSAVNWLAFLWAIGCGAVLVRVGLGQIKALRAVRRLPAWEDDVVRQVANELGIRVESVRCGAMPLVTGVFRPVLVLPDDFGDRAPEQRRAVALHELAHIVRRDCATQFAGQLVCALFWWNPLAWYAARQGLRERERAADDFVLNYGERGSDYATLLLEFAQRAGAAPAHGLAMARTKQVEGRLLAVLDEKVNRTPLSRWGVAFTSLAGLSVALLVASLGVAQAARIDVQDLMKRAETARQQEAIEELDRIASQLVEAGQSKKAREVEAQAQDLRKQKYGEDSLEYKAGLANVETLMAKGLYDTALAAVMQLKGGSSPEAGELLHKLGLVSYKAQNYEEARDYFTKALAIRSGDQARMAQTLTALAMTEEKLGHAPEAESYYRQASTLGDMLETAVALDAYVAFLQNAGRSGEVAPFVERSKAIHSRLVAQYGEPVRPASGSPAAKVGNGVSAPRLTYKVEPEYTEAARAAKYQGTVVLYVEVTPEGKAENLRLVRGIGFGLDERAAVAVSQWEFRPGTRDGSPVRVSATIEVNFRLL